MNGQYSTYSCDKNTYKNTIRTYVLDLLHGSHYELHVSNNGLSFQSLQIEFNVLNTELRRSKGKQQILRCIPPVLRSSIKTEACIDIFPGLTDAKTLYKTITLISELMLIYLADPRPNFQQWYLSVHSITA